MLTYPHTLRYSPEHQWARLETDGTVSIGVTDFAQFQLGEIQYFGAPRVGSTVRKGEPFGELESTKTVSDVYSPCSGEVTAVNDAIVSAPDKINSDAYGAGWLIRIRPADVRELDALLSSVQYTRSLEADEH